MHDNHMDRRHHEIPQNMVDNPQQTTLLLLLEFRKNQHISLHSDQLS